MKEGLLTSTLKVYNVVIVDRRAFKGKKKEKLTKNNHSNHINPPHGDNAHKFTYHPKRCG